MKHSDLKLLRIMFIIFIIFVMLSFICTIYADEIVDPSKYKPTVGENDQLNTATGTILGSIRVIGSIVSVVCVMIIGIKYMVSSSEGRASYKKQAVPYLIGAALTFAGCNILKIVYDAVNGL